MSTSDPDSKLSATASEFKPSGGVGQGFIPESGESWADQVEVEEATKEMDRMTTKDPIDSLSDSLLRGGSDIEVMRHHIDEIKPITHWGQLGIPSSLESLLFRMNYKEPSKIQAAILPYSLSPSVKCNVIAQSQSGTGKTGAFSLTMIMRVNPSEGLAQALCLCHTRELAIQISDVVDKMAGGTMVFRALKDVKIPKGKKIEQPIIVGTPGTIKRMIKFKNFDTKLIKVLVFDEADHMVGSFKKDSEFIQKQMDIKSCQILFFSATYDPECRAMARKLVPKPYVEMKIKKQKLTLDYIHQYFIDCNHIDDKIPILVDIYDSVSIGQSIIFVNTRRDGDMIHSKLKEESWKPILIHGGHTPDERDAIMEHFREKKANVLIATDVLARGIDVRDISLVVNYDMPLLHSERLRGIIKPDYDTYIHRIGRTGRFGVPGLAVNITHDDASRKVMRDIESWQGRTITKMKREDLDELQDKLDKMGFYSARNAGGV